MFRATLFSLSSLKANRNDWWVRVVRAPPSTHVTTVLSKYIQNSAGLTSVCCEHSCLGNTATSHAHTQGHAHRGHAHACLIKHGNKPSDWISSPHLICHMTKRTVRHACVRLIRLKSVMFGALALSDLWTSKLDATWWKRVITHMIHFTLLLQTPSGQWVCAAVLILKFNSESKMHLNQSNYIHLLHFMFFKYRSMIGKMSICV